jgi:hypothetical protein
MTSDSQSSVVSQTAGGPKDLAPAQLPYRWGRYQVLLFIICGLMGVLSWGGLLLVESLRPLDPFVYANIALSIVSIRSVSDF